MSRQPESKNDFEILILSPHDNSHDDSILEISNKTLGIGYVNVVEARSKPNVFTVVALDYFSKKTIGFILGKIVSIEDLLLEFAELRFEKESLDQENLFGILDPIGVDPSFQKMGIGKKLIESMVGILETNKAKKLVSPAWFYYGQDSSEPHINVGNALKSSGFYKFCQKDNYWANECKSGKFICPLNSSHCRCGVIFYQK